MKDIESIQLYRDEDYIKNIIHPKCWRESKRRIGSESTYGKIYKVCCKTNGEPECKYILKEIEYEIGLTFDPNISYNERHQINRLKVDKNLIQNEVDMQLKFYKKGLAPKLIDAYDCPNKIRIEKKGGFYNQPIKEIKYQTAYLIMEYMNIDVQTLIKTILDPENFKNINIPLKKKMVITILGNVIKLINKSLMFKLFHGDTHLFNFMLNSDFTYLDILNSLEYKNGKIRIPKKITYEDYQKNESLNQLLEILYGEVEDEEELRDIELSLENISVDKIENILNIKSMKFIDFGHSTSITDQNVYELLKESFKFSDTFDQLINEMPEFETELNAISQLMFVGYSGWEE
jgi:hypothetical protein